MLLYCFLSRFLFSFRISFLFLARLAHSSSAVTGIATATAAAAAAPVSLPDPFRCSLSHANRRDREPQGRAAGLMTHTPIRSLHRIRRPLRLAVGRVGWMAAHKCVRACVVALQLCLCAGSGVHRQSGRSRVQPLRFGAIRMPATTTRRRSNRRPCRIHCQVMDSLPTPHIEHQAGRQRRQRRQERKSSSPLGRSVAVARVHSTRREASCTT